ncbi:hypothetical protein [Sphingomonas montana]|uniref:hypothetical protein n=1 Tax=Sphingomonas montana TaxID=1843236 RepID=UPI00096F4455|nr:hypothetical protein [Sphingomonas montana]
MLDRENERDDTWFVCSRSAGRVSAAPVNAKGWVVFFLSVCGAIVAGLILARYGFSLHPVVGVVLLIATILIGAGLTIGLAVVKGRRVD